ncbi:MAG: hypothetical protein ABI699_09540 [Caldimonas sp.]
MATSPRASAALARASASTSGAFGAGLVLVVLPSLALVFGVHQFARHPVLGLPILAIFGIMILFGALALISTLFARLGLEDKGEALALPPGSVRAAIALALIVLFALISVMLYQTLGATYKIEGLSEAEKVALVKEPVNRVTAVIPMPCPPGPARPASDAAALAGASAGSAASGAERGAAVLCSPGQFVYTVHLAQAPSTESTDLAKQLLILIGTLMTSVTSFYFASRAAEASTKNAFAAAVAGAPEVGSAPTRAAVARAGPPGPTGMAGVAGMASPAGAADAAGAAHQHGADADADGCDAAIENPTLDEHLPAARGGVASPGAIAGPPATPGSTGEVPS